MNTVQEYSKIGQNQELIFGSFEEQFQMSEEFEHPHPEHPVCEKCGFCKYSRILAEKGEMIFSEGAYFQDGELKGGIPDFTPEGGWVVYIGEPLDHTAENPNKGQPFGTLADRNFARFASTMLEIGELHRVWYHPATKCRPMILRNVVNTETGQRGKVPGPPKKLTVTHYSRCWHFIWPEIKQLDIGAFILGSHAGCKMILDSGALESMIGKRYTVDIEIGGETRNVPAFPVTNTEKVWQDSDIRLPVYTRDLKAIFHKIDNPLCFDFVNIDGWMDFDYAFTKEEADAWFKPLRDKPRETVDKPLSYDVETSSIDKQWDGDFKVGIFSFDSPLQEKPLIVLTSDYKYVEEVYAKERPNAVRSFKEEQPALLETMADVLADSKIKKIGHNTSFDEKAIYHRYGWHVKGYLNDTRIMQYILNAEQQGGRTLNDLILKYLQWIPEYWKVIEKFKEENPQLGYNYVEYPPDLVIPYAAYDTKTVSMIYPIIRKLIKDSVIESFGGQFVMSDPERVYFPTYNLQEYAYFGRRVHYNLCNHLGKVGQHIDRSLLGRVAEVYEADLIKAEKKLSEFPQVKQFEWMYLPLCFKAGSANQKKIEKQLDPVRRMVAAHKGIEVSDEEAPPRFDWEVDGDILLHKEFDQHRPSMNWNSTPQVQMFFFEFMGYDPTSYTATENPSADKSSLTQLVEKQGCPVAEALLEFKEFEKFLTSFIRPLRTPKKNKPSTILKAHDLVHAEFKPAHPRSGRLSCGDPNVQQIPRDGLVKKLYNSRYRLNENSPSSRGWIVQRDYSGLEVRVLACVSQDPKLVDDFINGRDPHLRTQRRFFGDKADKHNKNQRSICKQVLFGRLYGQSAWGLLHLLRGKGVKSPFTGEEITLEECERLNQMIDELYPGVAEWVARAHQQAIQYHHVCSPFGFVRPLPVMESWTRYTEGMQQRDPSQSFGFLKSEIKGALRRAQNTPIQSAASDLTVFAGWEVVQRLKRERIKGDVFALVHDSIWVDVAYDEDVEQVIQIMHDTMDFTPEWLGDLLPGFDPSWLCVPIIGESEFGLNAKDTVTSCEEPSSKFPDRRLIVDVEKDFFSPRLAAQLTGVVETEGSKYWQVPFGENIAPIKKAMKAKRTAF